MKKINLLKTIAPLAIALTTLTTPLAAQTLVGDWQGNLVITESQKMQMVVHITKGDDGYKATIDVPAQKQFGMPFNKVEVTENKIQLAMDMANMKYSGTLKGNQLVGTYSQGAFSAPLNLEQAKQVVNRVKRPQEPTGSVPYLVEQVKFDNQAAGHQLAGTLTVPKGEVKSVAILLSGSGPSSRDADVAGHKVFLVLADKLSRQGIAVLRYDDRGVGESGGDFKTATSADFASDANAAYRFVKAQQQFSELQVGLIGHSEGGLIAAIAGAQNKAIDYVVSLAGPGTSGAQILIDQSYHIQQMRGVDKATLEKDDKAQKEMVYAIAKGISATELAKLMQSHGMSEQQAKAQSGQMTSPWFEYFVKTDPKQFLSQLKMPMLALNGELDAQVLADKNIDGIKQAVNSGKLTSKTYPGLNHLFQPATTGLPNEYGQIETTFSEQVIDDIANWINKLG